MSKSAQNIRILTPKLNQKA